MSRKLVVVAAAALALLVTMAPWIRSQQTGVLVVDGATLIDGTGAAPVVNSVIVIENGKITSIGPRARVRTPVGARVIDAKGKFVIPGLIDGHVHYRSWMGEMFLNNGVTTIFDLSNPTDWIIGVREAERTGKVRSMPRVFTTGQALNRPGANFGPGFASAFGGDAGTPAAPAPPGAPQGPEWARAATKVLLAAGVDAIKTMSDNLTADEVKAITEEAHKGGIPVLGHVTDIYRYVENGFDGVVHLWGVSNTLMTPENSKKWAEGAIMNPYAYMEPSKIDPLIKFMVEHHASVMPMLVSEHSGVLAEAREFESAVSTMYGDPELRYVPFDAVLSEITLLRKDRSYAASVGAFPYVETLAPAKLDEARRGYKNALDFTARFAKAGGRVFAGTDTPGAATVPGLTLRQEVRVLVDAGLTPMQALQACTKNTAEFFHKEAMVGTLQAGKFGDLVILDANPLADIRNIDKIRTVIKGGEVVNGGYHQTYHPPFWTDADDRINIPSLAPKPVLTSVIKESGTAQGSGSVTLAVKGEHFHGSSLVYLNGRPLETTFVTPSDLRATVSSGQLPAAGPYNVTVRTPWPGGGVTDAKPVSMQ